MAFLLKTNMTKPKDPKKTSLDSQVESPGCRYLAYCTNDGVCPYDIRDLMKKVRLQAIKDTLELIKLENGACPSVQIDDIQ